MHLVAGSFTARLGAKQDRADRELKLSPEGLHLVAGSFTARLGAKQDSHEGCRMDADREPTGS